MALVVAKCNSLSQLQSRHSPAASTCCQLAGNRDERVLAERVLNIRAYLLDHYLYYDSTIMYSQLRSVERICFLDKITLVY